MENQKEINKVAMTIYEWQIKNINNVAPTNKPLTAEDIAEYLVNNNIGDIKQAQIEVLEELKNKMRYTLQGIYIVCEQDVDKMIKDIKGE